ncbi:winged helix-turn-helix transcriptional regulator [Ruania zhangjianzhongii]|uniref:winged helix-turn-helix transcriptional regulator n=1 Tax=Ruania zhangjianzhongii TaxID=2603206 RepID=UPI0011C8B06B|nr:helix-turn-helix domain-containing protein [Ruania zhangjianzhongii]
MKDYGQFCGLAKAASILGERWALLILRTVMVSPQRFTELRQANPGIPSNVLTTRLRELEAAGVVERRLDAAPERGVTYALSDYGEGLRPILDALGRWGARRMLVPADGDVLTSSSLAAALQSAFVPGQAPATRTFSVRAGTAAAHTRVDAAQIKVGEGVADPSDLTIHANGGLRELLGRLVTTEEVLADGRISLDGPHSLFEDFVRIFHVPLDPDAAYEGKAS